MVGRQAARATCLVLPIVVAVACGRSGAPSDPAARDQVLERLRRFEEHARRAVDVRTQPPSHQATGPDPVAVACLLHAPLCVGLLGGRDAAVVLDQALREVARLDAPRSPSGIAVTPAGDVLASGALGGDVWRYRLRDGRLERAGGVPLAGLRAVRAIASGPEGVLYVAEEEEHRLVTLALDPPTGEPPGALLAVAPRLGLAPRGLLRTAHHLLARFVLSHDVVVLPVDARGLPRADAAVRVTHDGPVWAMDAVERDGGLVIALGGVEDHPLDRRQGSFGHVDSYVFVYRVDPSARSARRLAAVNVSKLGVVTPKVVQLETSARDVVVRVAGYGDATAAELRWDDPRPTRKGRWPEPQVATRPLVPGVAAAATLPGGGRLLADPLLDAWVLDDAGGLRVVPVVDPGRAPRNPDARVGEALFFTTLMAPWNRTRGGLSRFTCETCHLEGYVDGRVHHTGRDDVRVATRPLVGLGNVRPYFSRGLDPDLASMVDNEFRVANRRSRHDSWFALDATVAPWLAHLGVGREPLSPEDLRRALVAFLLEATPEPNPVALERTSFSAEERRGALAFLEHCEGCHQARLVADRPETRLPFAAWEAAVLSPQGPLVWARDGRERTGVEPYVHADGPRIPSLRRLARKRPYFTNGSAADLDAVLRRARVPPGQFAHDGAGDTGGALSDDERAALHRFLDLL